MGKVRVLRGTTRPSTLVQPETGAAQMGTPTGKTFTIAFLVLVVALILGALLVETTRGPSFRAADHADMQECVRNIPSEWRPGSLEYDGAEAACYYVHMRGAGQPP